MGRGGGADDDDMAKYWWGGGQGKRPQGGGGALAPHPRAKWKTDLKRDQEPEDVRKWCST